MNSGVIEEFERNRYGINIKKCCASCLHHTDGSKDHLRLCNRYGIENPLDYLCVKGWEMMRPGNPPKPGEINLQNAGRGDGSVKKPQYIKFVLDNGPGHADLYERQYGSRYLTKR